MRLPCRSFCVGALSLALMATSACAHDLTVEVLGARSDKGTRLRMALKGSDAGLVGALCTRSGLRPLAVQRTRLGRVGLAGLPAGAWRFLQGHEKF